MYLEAFGLGLKSNSVLSTTADMFCSSDTDAKPEFILPKEKHIQIRCLVLDSKLNGMHAYIHTQYIHTAQNTHTHFNVFIRKICFLVLLITDFKIHSALYKTFWRCAYAILFWFRILQHWAVRIIIQGLSLVPD